MITIVVATKPFDIFSYFKKMIIYFSFAFCASPAPERNADTVLLFLLLFAEVGGLACILMWLNLNVSGLTVFFFFSFPLKSLKYIHPVIHIRGVNGFSKGFSETVSCFVT